MEKAILITISIFVLVSAVFTFAVELEQEYPEVEDAMVQKVSEKTSLQEIIRYYSSWAIIIAILVTVGSVIMGGVQYLIAAGRPSYLMNAKSRIYNSLLGLAILVAAYLILTTINPQFAIQSVKLVPVRVGIVLFTEDGYNGFLNEDKTVKELVDYKEAKFLNFDIEDLEEFLSPLAVEKWGGTSGLEPPAPDPSGSVSVEKVNFAEFPLFAIGFWGGVDAETKVIFYPSKSMEPVYTPDGQIDPNVRPAVAYTVQGRIDDQGNPENPAEVSEHEGMKVVRIEQAENQGFFKSRVEFLKKHIELYQDLAKEEKKNVSRDEDLVLHPPLSVEIRHNGPGVYLYSQNREERFLSFSQSDFQSGEFDFDKRAKTLKIRNVSKTGKVHDFLAVLFEQIEFGGPARAFFVSREQKEEVPSFSTDGNIMFCDGTCRGLGAYLYDVSGSKGKIALDDYKALMDKIGYFDSLIVGNVPSDETEVQISFSEEEFEAADPHTFRYGSLMSVSSAGVYGIASDNSVCKEVRICDKEAFEGKCISYNFKGSSKLKDPEIGVAKYPMPLFNPINISPSAFVVTEILEENNEEVLVIESENFDNQIRSLKVEGDCLVGLFELPLVFESSGGSFVFKGWNSWWDLGPGTHTQLFRESVLDLSNEEIGRCGSEQGFTWSHRPCASAIVVYPINLPGSIVETPPSGIGSGGWQEALCASDRISNCNEISNPGVQISHAAPALASFLNCLVSQYPPKRVANATQRDDFNWVITSISDSAFGNSTDMTLCTTNYASPPCSHGQGSWHYGGDNCAGQSYAVDLVPRSWAGSEYTQLKNAITACGPDYFQEETSPHHFHADERNACQP